MSKEVEGNGNRYAMRVWVQCQTTKDTQGKWSIQIKKFSPLFLGFYMEVLSVNTFVINSLSEFYIKSPSFS